MFPHNRLSTEPVIGRFLPYYGEKLPNIDYCKAGIAINDGSKGLNVQLWKAVLKNNGDVLISSELNNYSDETFIVSFPGATNVSLSFDNNMTPAICVIVGGSLKFYWYDGTLPGYTVLTLANTRDALARIDDVRDFASSYRDIIISYIKDDKLSYRLSRDRYSVEYYLSNVNELQRIYQCGMTDKYRFQFSLIWDSDLVRSC